MNKLAPLAALCGASLASAQIPEAEVVLLADLTASGPGLVDNLGRAMGGADEGWVARASLADPALDSLGVIVGELSDDDPAGARVLRMPQTLGGVPQGALFRPRIAGGSIGYLAMNTDSGDMHAWLDDAEVGRVGGAAGSSGLDWLTLSSVFPLTGGGAIVQGTLDSGIVVDTALIESATGAVRLRRGQQVLGSSETIDSIVIAAISPSGNHVAARVVLAPSGDEAILLDGAIHSLAGGAVARANTSANGALPPAAGGVFTEFRRVHVTDLGLVVFEASVEGAGGGEPIVIRGGRQVLQQQAILYGVDRNGGAMTGSRLDPTVTAFEGLYVGFARDGYDLDDDGVTNTDFVSRNSFFEPSISGSGRIYRVNTYGDGSPGIDGLAVLRSVLKRAPEVVCDGVPNSSGSRGALDTVGSVWTGYNRMELVVWGLPINAFALPLVSRTPSAPTALPGSQGELCLGGSIGRMPFGLVASNFQGAGSSDLLLNLFPQGDDYVAVQPGETWYLQMWYRDNGGPVATSNLTNAIAVDFR